jgi:hypothetical protein
MHLPGVGSVLCCRWCGGVPLASCGDRTCHNIPFSSLALCGMLALICPMVFYSVRSMIGEEMGGNTGNNARTARVGHEKAAGIYAEAAAALLSWAPGCIIELLLIACSSEGARIDRWSRAGAVSRTHGIVTLRRPSIDPQTTTSCMQQLGIGSHRIC